jgi:hypothetical protein
MDYARRASVWNDWRVETIQKNTLLNVESVSYYGKSGIRRRKGDIMIPNAHINEGTADNFFTRIIGMFWGRCCFLQVYGLRSRNITLKIDLLKFFHESTWVIGLGGSYYQKAIQSASKIENFPDSKWDMLIMPLTILWNRKLLASGGLNTGVKLLIWLP